MQLSARSPDITPDFLLWGFMKRRVYVTSWSLEWQSRRSHRTCFGKRCVFFIIRFKSACGKMGLIAYLMEFIFFNINHAISNYMQCCILYFNRTKHLLILLEKAFISMLNFDIGLVIAVRTAIIAIFAHLSSHFVLKYLLLHLCVK